LNRKKFIDEEVGLRVKKNINLVMGITQENQEFTFWISERNVGVIK